MDELKKMETELEWEMDNVTEELHAFINGTLKDHFDWDYFQKNYIKSRWWRLGCNKFTSKILLQIGEDENVDEEISEIALDLGYNMDDLIKKISSLTRCIGRRIRQQRDAAI